MQRTRLVERKLGIPRPTKTTPTQRVVAPRRFPKRDPPATTAKHPRRNARLPSTILANQRRQRNAKRARIAAESAVRPRRNDPLVANPTRTRINQLERGLDDASQRLRPAVSSRLQRLSFRDSAVLTALFPPLYAKNAVPQATARTNRRSNAIFSKRKNADDGPFPTPKISGIIRIGGSLRRRSFAKIGKLDITARFSSPTERKFLRRVVFFVKISFLRLGFYRNNKYCNAFGGEVSSNVF